MRKGLDIETRDGLLPWWQLTRKKNSHGKQLGEVDRPVKVTSIRGVALACCIASAHKSPG